MSVRIESLINSAELEASGMPPAARDFKQLARVIISCTRAICEGLTILREEVQKSKHRKA